MSLGTTAIEYVLNPDGTPGRIWNPVVGCAHGLDVCAISANCWAREQARRRKWEFRPQLHPDVVEDPHGLRKPSTIAVGWAGMSGDMWGEWWQGNWDWAALVLNVVAVMRETPQHRYLLLSKNPARYADFGPWPPNAWLGVSITGAESEDVQAQRIRALGKVQGNQWVSYEPMLGPLAVRLCGTDWLVVGGISGKHGMTPEQTDWYYGALDQAKTFHIPMWLKSNLFPTGTSMRPAWQQRPRGLTL